MAFNDKDLKTLKMELNNGYTTLTTTDGMQALLARLDAAELTISHLLPYVPLGERKDCATYQAWLKSAGRTEGQGD